MTTISTLSPLPASARYAPAGAQRDTFASAAAAAGEGGGSGRVSLSADGLAAARAAADAALRVPASARFKEAGAFLRSAFEVGAPAALDRSALPTDVDQRFTLSVVTASGKKVELTLASRDDEFLVRVGVDAGVELNDAERDAVAGLAQGFQDAVDGMASQPPQLRLAGLSGFDSSALQSVDLRAAVKLQTSPPATQTLDFHVDGQRRSVAVDGPSGKLNVSVSTGTLEALGTRQQQDRAIAGYLKQFDDAATRGHGDRQLMTMFKDAFSDLSRTSLTDDAAAVGTTKRGGSWALSRADHAVLTGLPDFSASVTQASQLNNPARRDEVTAFRYEASQKTQVGGASWAERSVSQTRESRLSAQFHTPLRAGAELAFDFSSGSQNYRHHQIDDTSRSDVTLQYKEGKLLTAAFEHMADQSERVREYTQGRMTSDTTIPSQQRILRDLVAALDPYRAGRTRHGQAEHPEARQARHEASLNALNADILSPGR